jgi:hypothetical protein
MQCKGIYLRINEIFTNYVYWIITANLSSFSIKAAPAFDSIKDLSGPFHKKYSHLSPVIGADETGLRNFKFQGRNYGSQPQEQFPRYEKRPELLLPSFLDGNRSLSASKFC